MNKAKKDRIKWENRMCRMIRKAEMDCAYDLTTQPFYDLVLNKDLTIEEIKTRAKCLTDSSVIRIWE